MIIIGIILVLIALLLAAALLMGTSTAEASSQELNIHLFDTVTISLTPLTLVIAGMATMFVLWLGLALIKTRLTRKAQRRKVRKQQEVETRDRQLQHERGEQDRQAAEREQQRAREQSGRGPASTEEAGMTRPIPREDRGPVDDGTRPISRDGLPADATRPIRRDGGTPCG